VGHANLSNISDFFVKRLYAKGKLSVQETVDALQKAGETVHASEGSYDDPYMLAFALSEILTFMLGWEDGPIIEAVDLTDEQEPVLEAWLEDGEDAFGNADETLTALFDSIKWKFSPGWRKRYPDIPRLGSVTN
jgi:hypothetical protein